jgi:pimeloyl-ACP methyl ester carboxylesterase
VEAITRGFPQWFHPRLRFFSGREDRLPVDANLLVSLVAPRACLIAYALNDSFGNPWGDEQTYLSALDTYRFLGQPERLALHSRAGGHGLPPAAIEAGIDWLDIQFGRSKRTWTSTPVHDYEYQRWLKHAVKAPAPAKATNVETTRAAVRWALGEKPAQVAGATAGENLTPAVLKSGDFYGWRRPESDLATVVPGVRFGAGVTGDLFLPADILPTTRVPVVIWLHGYGYANGYWWPYRGGLHPILALVQAGYGVLAFDQTGFGHRILEAQHFEDRYPAWSQLGRMVDDTRAAVDFLSRHERVDPKRIYLLGYALGGTVALHTAALEPRVAGVVSVSGFTPMRAAGGVDRWALERGLLPRLGAFAGHEKDGPYDFDDLLSAIAPRPVLVVQPQLDRDAAPAAVREAVERARGAYSKMGAADHLTLNEPWDYNRLPDSLQNWIVNAWMVKELP